ncbi:MAG: hypothetical protein Q9202_007207 [Teloschistes flavicans]
MPATKGKKRTSEAAVDDYESDGGFIANDSDPAPKSKKAKTVASKKAPPKSASAQGNDDEEFWEITPNRRISIINFQGQKMINIREYYKDKNGDGMLPGKKVGFLLALIRIPGIALPIAQYSTLLTLLPEIEAALTAKGETVPRPDFTSLKAAAANDPDQQEEKDSKGTRKNRKPESTKKRNFDATSDENDEAEEAD